MLGKTRGIFGGFKPYSLRIGSLSENSVFLEERTATIVSSEGNAKVFILLYIIIQIAKELCRVSTARFGKK